MCKFEYVCAFENNAEVCTRCHTGILGVPTNYSPMSNVNYKALYKGKNNEKQNALNKIIKKVIFNPPATIVYWYGGEKTVVKCSKDECFDPEKGLAMAFMKYFFNNHGYYNDVMKKFTKPYYEKCMKEIIGMAHSGDSIGYGEFTVKEIAEYFGVSKDTVRRDIKRGCYPDAYKKNGKWIIPIKEEESH